MKLPYGKEQECGWSVNDPGFGSSSQCTSDEWTRPSVWFPCVKKAFFFCAPHGFFSSQLASVILKQYVETHWCAQSEKFRPPETTERVRTVSWSSCLWLEGSSDKVGRSPFPDSRGQSEDCAEREGSSLAAAWGAACAGERARGRGWPVSNPVSALCWP